jgi:hypothetical protein
VVLVSIRVDEQVVLVVGAVVSSIVLEAFAAKREQAHRIENDIDTVDFVSGLTRSQFEEVPGVCYTDRITHGAAAIVVSSRFCLFASVDFDLGVIKRVLLTGMGAIFDKTRDRIHNIRHYFYFAVHLDQKQASEFTGQESYCRDKLLARDLEFLPINRCSVLDKARAKRQRLGVHATGHENASGKVAPLSGLRNMGSNAQHIPVSSVSSGAYETVQSSVSTGTSNTGGSFDNIRGESSVAKAAIAGSIGGQTKHQQDSLSVEHVSLNALEQKMSRKFREQRQLLSLHAQQGESVLVHAAKVDNLGKVDTQSTPSLGPSSFGRRK